MLGVFCVYHFMVVVYYRVFSCLVCVESFTFLILYAVCTFEYEEKLDGYKLHALCFCEFPSTMLSW